ncbi:MAG: A/G-specific adenine glycosylase [Candidatus Parcubacteria bacterium]|jgi:A/G-specific adenine glycosylase
MTIKKFQKTIWDFYKKQGRKLPWRETFDPYKILISETMLQQTQVARVFKKYESFLSKFPSVEALAQAPLKDLLLQWQGLGYNRRALNLKKTAEIITKEYKGIFPKDRETLLSLPGVGQSTAGALIAFSYNKPSVFIETNIRSVFIHFFFPKAQKVDDKKILPLIAEAVDVNNPKHWYYALMDYGVMLKQNHVNPSRKSASHTKQSTFKGSWREKRSRTLKHILAQGTENLSGLSKYLLLEKTETKKILDELTKEGFLTKNSHQYTILEPKQ